MHTHGKGWEADCSTMPSEKNCQLYMWAPEDQKQDLVDAGIAHAVSAHSHTDTPELRAEMEKILVHTDA